MFNISTILKQLKANLQGEYAAFDIFPLKLTISFAAFLLHLGFLLLFYFLNIIELFYFNIFSIAMWWWAVIESAKDNYFKATLIGTTEIISHAIYACLLLGIATGFNLYLWSLLAWLAFTFPNRHYGGIVLSMLCVVILIILYVSEQFNLITPAYNLDETLTLTLFISNVFFACSLLIVTTFFVRRSVENQKFQLEQLATHDQLTQLYNRHYFNEFIQKHKQKALRDNEPYCLVMADVDHFKKINDTFGHSKGDKILKLVADYLQKNLRAHDVIARWGGEEFLFILVNCNKQEATNRVEKLRLGFSENILIDKENQTIERITMSFGVVESDHNKTTDELISMADELLFEAKRSGRNKVITEASLAI